MSPLRLNGSTSGFSQLDAPAIAGDQTFTLPGTGGTIDRLNRAGNILQVVSATKTDHFSTTASVFTDVTGLSVTITPSSSSNKILIYASVSAGLSDFYNLNYFWKLLRGSTDIAIGTSGTFNYTGGHNMHLSASNVPFAGGTSKMHLDSPNTTSATTYKVQVSKNDSAGIIYVNRRGNSTVEGSVSSITLLEVAA